MGEERSWAFKMFKVRSFSDDEQKGVFDYPEFEVDASRCLSGDTEAMKKFQDKWQRSRRDDALLSLVFYHAWVADTSLQIP